jgi:hypothetical protein
VKQLPTNQRFRWTVVQRTSLQNEPRQLEEPGVWATRGFGDFAKVYLGEGQSTPPLEAVRASYDEQDHAIEAMLSESGVLERVEQTRVYRVARAIPRLAIAQAGILMPMPGDVAERRSA